MSILSQYSPSNVLKQAQAAYQLITQPKSQPQMTGYTAPSSFSSNSGNTGTVGYNASSPSLPIGTTFNQSTGQPTGRLLPNAASTTYSGSSSSSSGSGGSSTPSVGNQIDDYGQMIDRDYESAMGGLNAQESDLQGQAGAATQAAEAGYAPARTAIGNEQATREQGLTNEEQTANRQSQSSLQQARDLFKQIQQENIAQLSGLGISSSSVSEALAERLGTETARRIAGVTGSTNEIMQNIAGERTRTQTYYKQKLSDLEQGLASSKSQIQNSLLQGLNQINAARNQAANDKANRRQELLLNAQNQMAQLQQQAQQFAQSLTSWNQQRTTALEDAQRFSINPTDFGSLNQYSQQVSQLPQVAGFSAVPSYTPNTQGYYKPGIKYTKANEEELQNPFAQ